jgi:hypothetical protein
VNKHPADVLIERVRRILDDTPEWNSPVLDHARSLLSELKGVRKSLRELEELACDHNMHVTYKGRHARAAERSLDRSVKQYCRQKVAEMLQNGEAKTMTAASKIIERTGIPVGKNRVYLDWDTIRQYQYRRAPARQSARKKR